MYDRIATPKVALELAEAFGEGGAQLEMFEESGHRPWLEESAAYFAALREFLGAAGCAEGRTRKEEDP